MLSLSALWNALGSHKLLCALQSPGKHTPNDACLQGLAGRSHRVSLRSVGRDSECIQEGLDSLIDDCWLFGHGEVPGLA